jgi:deoxyribonuclease V
VAHDLHDQVVITDTVPILERAVRTLGDRPDVLLVDATGTDHPRRAGLAVHLGWVLGLPTVGVTHRTLHAPMTDQPPRRRGTRVPIEVAGETIAHWVHTTDVARPLVAHAGWRTDADQAADVTLLASTPSARTPVPLGEARRAAREARAIAGGEWA